MAESLWKRFAPLPVEVESYALERLEQPVTRGFSRVTTVVHLHGAGQEGLGEDVTWYAEAHDREQAAGPMRARRSTSPCGRAARAWPKRPGESRGPSSSSSRPGSEIRRRSGPCAAGSSSTRACASSSIRGAAGATV